MNKGGIMDENHRIIIDFRDSNECKNWRIVNDDVMGGLSQSRIVMTKNSTAIFQGTVSLKNHGGFASVHTIPRDYGLDKYEGLKVRVKGDGKTYQLRLRTDDRTDGISYHAEFQTVYEEWINVDITFDSFTAKFHGRLVPDTPKLVSGNIRQIGFLISDKQEGDFHLEIGWIKTYCEKK